MAYKIRKSSHITEDLELLGDNGEVEKVISVDIDISRIMTGCRGMEITLLNLQKEAKKKQTAEAVSNFGKAVVEFFYMIFGEDNTKEMLDFFDGKYVDMFIQVMPFYYDVIKPALEIEIKNKRSDLASNHSFTRQQRRRLGLR